MATKDQGNFTKAYEELEAIVASFESGNIDLERDLPKFERGLKLAKFCTERLKELENHVQTVERRFHADSPSASRTTGVLTSSDEEA